MVTEQSYQKNFKQKLVFVIFECPDYRLYDTRSSQYTTI